MTILGIDPGIATVSYGIIQYENGRFRTIATGAIETPAGIDVENRLEIVYNDLCELIQMYSPTEMAIEELFFNTNQKTAIAVAEARGVILLAARKNNLNIAEYTPIQVKMAVTGYGRAEKKQVQEMVKIILGLPKIPKPDDAADALALAICHAHCGGSKIQQFYNGKKKKLV